MKFSCKLEVEAPRDFVVKHFSIPDNQLKWHSDMKSIKLLEGKPGEQGCKTLLEFEKFQIVETVLSNDLPDNFLGDYETPGICHNTMRTQFESNGSHTYVGVTVDYKKMNWFMKGMSILMPWALKGPVKKYLNQFKQVVESEFQYETN